MMEAFSRECSTELGAQGWAYRCKHELRICIEPTVFDIVPWQSHTSGDELCLSMHMMLAMHTTH